MKKKILFTTVFVLIHALCFSEENNVTVVTQEQPALYRLYSTQNMWTFLQLETATGRIYQIQFSINDNNRGGVVLNAENLADGEEYIIGRFILYPTTNMWTFILLDQITGATWQVQWSFDAESRFVIPIFY